MKNSSIGITKVLLSSEATHNIFPARGALVLLVLAAGQDLQGGGNPDGGLLAGGVVAAQLQAAQNVLLPSAKEAGLSLASARGRTVCREPRNLDAPAEGQQANPDRRFTRSSIFCRPSGQNLRAERR